jgi:hypothetical protein
MSIKSKNAADSFWHKLNNQKKVIASVTMTPEQFRKMLAQASEHGYKQGFDDGIDRCSELYNLTQGDKPININDLFSGGLL